MNDEKTEVIPVTLPLEVWGILAIKADAKGMTLSDYVIELALHEATQVEDMMFCAEDWLKYDLEWKDVVMMDPDGWDRQNFEESWAECITRDEMCIRMSRSTTMDKKS